MQLSLLPLSCVQYAETVSDAKSCQTAGVVADDSFGWRENAFKCARDGLKADEAIQSAFRDFPEGDFEFAEVVRIEAVLVGLDDSSLDFLDDSRLKSSELVEYEYKSADRLQVLAAVEAAEYEGFELAEISEEVETATGVRGRGRTVGEESRGPLADPSEVVRYLDEFVFESILETEEGRPKNLIEISVTDTNVAINYRVMELTDEELAEFEGFYTSWLRDEGFVFEGGSTNRLMFGFDRSRETVEDLVVQVVYKTITNEEGSDQVDGLVQQASDSGWTAGKTEFTDENHYGQPADIHTITLEPKPPFDSAELIQWVHMREDVTLVTFVGGKKM